MQGKEQNITSASADLKVPAFAKSPWRIANAEAILWSTINNAPIVIWTVDKNGIYTLSEGKALSQVGLKPGELVGKSHFELYQDFPEVAEHVHRALRGETFDAETSVFGRTYLTNYSPVRSPTGEIEGVTSVSHDITERKISSEEKRIAIENERENFRNLFRQTPEMVCILKGPDHVFEFVNDAHVRALGFDATGMAVREAQPESVEVHGILDEVYHTGKTAELHEIPVTLTDRRRYFNLTYAARRDIAGRINGVMILGMEVTEQVESRAALERSRDELNFTLASAKMGTWSVNLASGKVALSREAAHIFGFAREYENADAAIDDFIHPEDRAQARRVLGRALEENAPYFDEYRICRPDGGVRWIQVRGRVHKSEAGDGVISGVAFDTTERKEAAEALEAAVRTRDEFISIASHELKTPITSLKLQAQILQRQIRKGDFTHVSPAAMDEFAGKTLKQLEQLTRLVDDMLDIARINSGRLEYGFVECDLAELLAEGYRGLAQHFADSLVAVNVQTESAPVRADSFRMKQVITNLLTNARKYGKGRPVYLEVKREGEEAVLSVRDSGIGIAPENQERIFNRFERAISAADVSGLGLGLYISKQIVLAHGGSIRVESELGKGSTFIVRLPLVSG